MSDVPVHAYPAKHRGEPRRCAACFMPETEAKDLHAFYDKPARDAQTIALHVSGRHRANTPTLEGP